MSRSRKRQVLRELTGFDVLSDVLGSLGLRSRLFCRSQLAAPWTMSFAAGALSHFHIIERGGVWLLRRGHAPLALAAGDLLVIRRGTAYQLSDEPAAHTAHLVKLPEGPDSGRCVQLRNGRKGPMSAMICGSFAFEREDDHPLLALLPALMHLRAATQGAAWIEPLGRMLLAEATDMRPGAETVLSRLTDVLFVQILRAWLAEQRVPPSWLKALSDARIGPALALMHENPGHSWTVGRLAASIGMSRSPFTARFTRLVGTPPQAYLTQLRMQRAARLLREHARGLGEIARAVGYESEAAFNRAFKRHHGSTPGRYRRR